MNLTQPKFLVAIAIVTGLLVSNSFGQEYWGAGQPSSCSQRGGCSRGYDSVGMMPYGVNNNQVGGCGYGDSCNLAQYPSMPDHGYSAESCPDGLCPYEQRRQLETRGNGYGASQLPYASTYDPRSQPSGGPGFSPPAPPRSENYQSSPADIPPRLSSPPSYPPSSNYAANNASPQPGDFGLPPQTSNQLTSPPFLPPSNSFSSPASTESHAGHDHSGHNH